MTQKTYDELAEAWAEEIVNSDEERASFLELTNSLKAQLAATEDKLLEHSAVIGVLCNRGKIRIRKDELASAPPFDVMIENGELVLRKRGS